jgi:hypothetical protein
MTDCNKDDGHGSMIGGIIVLGVGLYFLAWNSDLIPDPGESWPIFLIIVGIALVIGNIFKKKPADDSNQQQL